MICYSSSTEWKILPCCHKLCFSCYIKLIHESCPYCRQHFKYSVDEINIRHNKNINHIPQQLTNSFNELTIDSDYNIPNSRTNRQRFRKRRRNLTEDEVKERRRIIKKKCKNKWTCKENRMKKWYHIMVE